MASFLDLFTNPDARPSSLFGMPGPPANGRITDLFSQDTGSPGRVSSAFGLPTPTEAVLRPVFGGTGVAQAQNVASGLASRTSAGLGSLVPELTDKLKKVLGMTPSPPAVPVESVQAAGIPQQYASVVHSAAQETGVDPYLLAGLLRQESQWNPQALSKMGAQGLGQLMPDTARGLGVQDPWNPEQNVRGAARYLAQQMRAYNNDVTRALVAYNGGGGAVAEYNAGRPYAESQAYLQAVQQYADQYRQRANTVQPWTAPPAGPAQGLLAAAEAYKDVPYAWGGSTKAGVDCSGLVIAAAKDAGTPLQGRPTAQGIFNQVPKVDAQQVQPGDLVFFQGTAGANPGEVISHVGIVTAQGVMLNAPQPGDRVRYMRYDDPYWQPKIAGFGRLPAQ